MAKWEIAFPVDVQLRHGPLRIPRRKRFVLEEDMDELLLDRATLKELGMDVGAVLEQARVSQLDQARASQGKQLYIPIEEMRPKSKDDVMRKQDELVQPLRIKAGQASPSVRGHAQRQFQRRAIVRRCAMGHA
jgi:hypothetical protein